MAFATVFYFSLNLYLLYGEVSRSLLNFNFSISILEIPYDGYAQKKIREYNAAFVTVFTLLASAGVMFAGVCLAFNIIFRKRK